MKIGIVVGSIRDERLGAGVGEWAMAGTADRDADYELIDLKEFDVPLLTSATHPMQAGGNYESEAVNRWGRAIGSCNAFVFVTAEYNHGVPGAFKNAVDSLGVEWMNKPVAFIGYGSVSGVRAIEQWRQIVLNFSMLPIRSEINLSMFTDITDGKVTAPDRTRESLASLFDELEDITRQRTGEA